MQAVLGLTLSSEPVNCQISFDDLNQIEPKCFAARKEHRVLNLNLPDCGLRNHLLHTFCFFKPAIGWIPNQISSSPHKRRFRNREFCLETFLEIFTTRTSNSDLTTFGTSLFNRFLRASKLNTFLRLG